VKRRRGTESSDTGEDMVSPVPGWAHLDGKVSSVHVISQEQVPGIRRVPTDFEQLHQVVLSFHIVKNWKTSQDIRGDSKSLERERQRNVYSMREGTDVLTVNISADGDRRIYF
jgi:hypothetical protein